MVNNIISWVVRIIPSFILLQTLYYKFGDVFGIDDQLALAQTTHIFSSIGMEPWGRYTVGCIEVICGILLLIPAASWIGASGAIVIMIGGIFSHLIYVGVTIPTELMDDGQTLNLSGETDSGALFMMAFIVLISCSIILYRDKEKLKNIL